MSRFGAKTYSRIKGKDSMASQAFDDIFDDGPSKPATRTAATSQKWGKTTFTSVRDMGPDAAAKRRKVQAPAAPMPSDPFTFESDEGGISPEKKVTKLTTNASLKDTFLNDRDSIMPLVKAPATNQEQFRPVKRFFRTHKGFLTEPVSKPAAPATKKAPAVKKNRTKVKNDDRQMVLTQELSVKGKSSSQSEMAVDSFDWLSDETPPSPPCPILDRHPAIPSNNFVTDSGDRRRVTDNHCSVETSSPQKSSPYTSLTDSKVFEDSDSEHSVPQQLFSEDEKVWDNELSGSSKPANSDSDKAKTEEIVLYDDPTQVTTPVGSPGSPFTETPSSMPTLSSSQPSQPTSTGSAKSTPSSQGVMNKRLLLKKHRSDSPVKSPAKRYNPRQWIADGSPPEGEPLSRTASLPASRSSSQTNSAPSFDFDDDSPMPSLSRQNRVMARPGVKSPNITSVKISREHKTLYTVVQNVKDVHECQEHGETQEFQDDIAYLLDGLTSRQTVTTRCLSTLSLANKCIEPVFRMHLRAHGTVTRIFTALKDACLNPCLAMSTSLIMFMLSRDRLSVDVDQDGMEMMINLLDADVKNRKMKPGMVKDYQRIKQRVYDVIAQLKKDGGAKNMELSEVSTSNLATETLLALSSRRSGDSFKEEMRTLGGLDHIVHTVADCTDSISDDHISDLTDSLVDTVKKIDRCLRILENVTYLNSDNQAYLISYSSSSLITSLCSLLRISERVLKLFPVSDPPETENNDNDKDDKAKRASNEQERCPSRLVFQCLLSVLRVLLNITHDNVWGSQKVGQTDGLMNSALLCALCVPQYAPHSERFDLLVLTLGMIINLVEHCEINRRLLVNTETLGYYDSEDSNTQKEALEALTELFLQKESAAGKLEESVSAPQSKTDNTDKNKDSAPSSGAKTDEQNAETEEPDSGLYWVIGKKKKADGEEESDDEEQHIEIIPSSVEDEENFTKALHKAGKHMEDSIVAAYVALLIGCIIRENANLVEKVRELLPDGSFEPMVNILTKFLGFMNLTSGVAAQHSSKSIAEIIQVIDKL